jgi:hypothetical protein
MDGTPGFDGLGRFQTETLAEVDQSGTENL